jgi:hypothetical protein
MTKKSDIVLSSVYEGDMFKDLPLTLQFLKSMTPEKDTVEPGTKKEPDTKKEINTEKKAKGESSIKAIVSTLYKSKMHVCYEFYRPISKLIHPPKNESDITK